MKKIAIFVDNLNIGGIQKSIINILNNIDREKYRIDLYLFDRDIFYKNEIPKDVKIIFLNKSKTYYKFIPFKLAFKLNKTNNFNHLDYEYDLAIDFDTYQFNTAYNTIKCPSKKKIMWIHNDIYNEIKYNFKYRILHFFMKGKYKFFSNYVGVSDGVIAPFRIVNKIKNFNYKVIPNIINTKEIFDKCNETVDDIDLDESKYNLVTVGRLCHQKGYDILIKQFKSIVEKRKDIHLYIIGDGEEKNKLVKLVDKLSLNNYITFTGKKKNPFKYERIMDGFVLTSRYEGQGMVILEAKALGLDIFIGKNIEKYNGYNIKGTDDLINTILKAKKNKNKKYDDLKKYNNSIISSLNNLFDN